MLISGELSLELGVEGIRASDGNRMRKAATWAAFRYWVSPEY